MLFFKSIKKHQKTLKNTLNPCKTHTETHEFHTKQTLKHTIHTHTKHTWNTH